MFVKHLINIFFCLIYILFSLNINFKTNPMKTTSKIIKSCLLLCAVVFMASCSNDDDPAPIVEADPDIVDLALATGDLSNLVAALQRADLVSALQADGPFTVFAPTNAAFEAFLAANNFASLEDVPVDVLTQVLLNHVVVGEFTSGSLSTQYVSSLVYCRSRWE